MAIVSLLLLSLSAVFLQVSAGKNVVCYYSSWATYRWGDGKFDVENIDPHLCSHYIYAFAGLDYNNRVVPLDPYLDLEENWGRGNFKKFTNLKRQNPKLKTLLGVGGWNEGSQKYSTMAQNSLSRKIFIDSAVQLLKKHNFDGLDMDWEYPGSRDGAKPEDKENYSLLLKELKEEFSKHGLMLSAALSAGKDTIDKAYEIPEISKYLDMMNVMTYDYHGATWESFTGANSPMYNSPRDENFDPLMNVNYSINYWISKGAPPEKIILGVPLYGHTYNTAAMQGPNYFYQTAYGPGMAGPWTNAPGTMGYHEICKLQREQEYSWDVLWDDEYQVPYMVQKFISSQFISYDDIKSVKIKAEFAKSMGLGGVMSWSIDTDDFRNICGQGRYVLMETMKKEL